MSDMNDILRMAHEGVNFEAKSAVGGLPKSLWETYCAFANTEGGVIVLGAAERKDGSLEIVGVEKPDQLIKSFWYTINNRAKVSLNILSDRDVSVADCEGKKVIRIRVPRADRADRPIFLNKDLFAGTFRRNGEGDYRCSESEVKAMVRDADAKSQDLTVLPWATINDLNLETVHRYRNRMQSCRPGHVWLDLDDVSFLRRIGALAFDDKGTLHATCAGLLMFGNEYDIVREFPNYFLDYQERFTAGSRWSDRIISSSGEWSGNVYDFYFRVYNKIVQTVKVPFRLKGQVRVDDTPIHQAIREALVNCVVNADYRLARGIVIVRSPNSLGLSNPGSFRVPVSAVHSGGVSDPRNETLLKMFTLINIGERAGSGIPSIDATWKDMKWSQMRITESAEPARVCVELELRSVEPVNEPANRADEPVNEPVNESHEPVNTEAVVRELKRNKNASYDDLARQLHCSRSTVRRRLDELKAQGRIVYVGSDKNGYWEVYDNR